MDEIEMKKQSFDIQKVSNEIKISDSESLGVVFEILKALKKHKENITNYWKSAKESAKKTYQNILFKEKQMINVCENSEKVLKDKILSYKQIQAIRYQKLINQAEIERKNQIKKVLSEALNLKIRGKCEESKLKFSELEKLERAKLSLNLHKSPNKINTQKRFKCKVTDNKLVPCFFNEVEIREIDTKKLLDIRKENPDIEIPGVKFYIEENLVMRSI